MRTESDAKWFKDYEGRKGRIVHVREVTAPVSAEALEWLHVMQQNGATDFVQKWAAEIIAALPQKVRTQLRETQ